MNAVSIVDYGMCNLDSVARAIEECGGTPSIARTAADFKSANRIVLPGVGAFSDAMHHIRDRHLDAFLHEQVIENRIPFLGICLGMQLLATAGYEGGNTEGLGWIAGEVLKLQPDGNDTRVPHIGWNNIQLCRESALLKSIDMDRDFYFVHSYHFVPTDDGCVVARTPYCGSFVSAVQYKWIYGVQFHPEKSQKVGFAVLRNFLAV